MAIAYINIGSNVGNREALIGQAVAHIEFLCRGKARKAPLIESEPWGFRSAHKFLNLGIAIITHLEPHQLLAELLKIEKRISPHSHRDENGNYVDRKIDIDLIAIDEMVINAPTLQLPHPRMHLRDFVVTPMMHLNPSWVHPILNQSITDIYNKLLEKDNKPLA